MSIGADIHIRPFTLGILFSRDGRSIAAKGMGYLYAFSRSCDTLIMKSPIFSSSPTRSM